jgi:hypothetical protein
LNLVSLSLRERVGEREIKNLGMEKSIENFKF